MSVTVKAFDKLRDGRIANLYTIENQKGMQAVLTDFGAVLVKLLVPDQDGKLRDVVLGYDELEKYEDNFDMLGTTVGRNVNRIEKGRFTIDGVSISWKSMRMIITFTAAWPTASTRSSGRQRVSRMTAYPSPITAPTWKMDFRAIWISH